ncbi:protein of unknown function [uncultured Sphingopyxis sp.]|uniref:Uncharacterized protein n=1 Tax=uncultured Sphingopyxis sp. TaxID=310581 RepID=A0A1Y5PWE1_9SPHN|nr:protein of unknown function [uncultured Sphingopyxis sp.]
MFASRSGWGPSALRKADGPHPNPSPEGEGLAFQLCLFAVESHRTRDDFTKQRSLTISGGLNRDRFVELDRPPSPSVSLV